MIGDEEYRHIREHYLEPESEWGRARIERVMEALRPGRGERILDIGCGNGTFLFHASGAGAWCAGIDRDEGVLLRGREAAERFSKGEGRPCATGWRVRCDGSSLPFIDAAFGKAVSADFAEHVDEETLRAVCREARRVLSPGGILLIYTPNRARLEAELYARRMKESMGIGKATESPASWRDLVDPDHRTMHSAREVIEAVESAGFRTEERFFEFHWPILSRVLPGLARLSSILPGILERFSNRVLVIGMKE